MPNEIPSQLRSSPQTPRLWGPRSKDSTFIYLRCFKGKASGYVGLTRVLESGSLLTITSLNDTSYISGGESADEVRLATWIPESQKNEAIVFEVKGLEQGACTLAAEEIGNGSGQQGNRRYIGGHGMRNAGNYVDFTTSHDKNEFRMWFRPDTEAVFEERGENIRVGSAKGVPCLTLSGSGGDQAYFYAEPIPDYDAGKMPALRYW